MSLPDGHKAVRVRIEGRVQGVWFRAWTCQRAKALELDGWVRNRQDGTVEALIVGPESAVDQLVAACRKGPPAADVARVDVERALGIVVKGFHQKPSV